MTDITRREIVAGTAALALTSVSHAALAQQAAKAAPPPKLNDINIECAFKDVVIDGNKVRLRAWNDQVPGPLMKIFPGQRLRINVDLAVVDEDASSRSRPGPARPGVGHDELSRVVDYEAVADNVRTIVAAGHVRLVETLAERLAESCLLDARVRTVRIRVEKLDIFADTASVGVEIERHAADAPSI